MQEIIREKSRFKTCFIISILINGLIFGCIGQYCRLSAQNSSEPSQKLVRIVTLAPLPTVPAQPKPVAPTQKLPSRPVRQARAIRSPKHHVSRLRFAFRRRPTLSPAGSSPKPTLVVVRLPHMPSSAVTATKTVALSVYDPTPTPTIAPFHVHTPAPQPSVSVPTPVIVQSHPTPVSVAPAISTPTVDEHSAGHGGSVGTPSSSTQSGGASGLGDGSGTGHGEGTESGSGSGSGGPFGIGAGGGGGDGGGPKHVMYVLDVSPSMTSRIDRARSELRSALESLRPCDSFDVELFGGVTQMCEDTLVSATNYKKAEAEEFLDAAQLVPGTNLDLAMKNAFGVPGVDIVVVITDGVPTEGETNFNKLAKLINRRNVNRARIYTIGLVGRNPNDGSDDTFQATKLLQTISSDSGGESKLATVGVETSD